MAVLVDVAAAATMRLDEHGTVMVDNRKVFPIRAREWPEADGLDEVVAAGVNFLKVDPAARPWWPEECVGEQRPVGVVEEATETLLVGLARPGHGLYHLMSGDHRPCQRGEVT